MNSRNKMKIIKEHKNLIKNLCLEFLKKNINKIKNKKVYDSFKDFEKYSFEKYPLLKNHKLFNSMCENIYYLTLLDFDY